MTGPLPSAGRHKTFLLIVNILLVCAIAAGITWGLYTYYRLDHDLYTNDAQVEEDINPINARITGYIKEVRYTDHQHVKKGDTLLIVDDREYRIQYEQAEAGYLSAIASKGVAASSVTTVQSNLSVSDANIKAMEARLWNTEQNYHRFENLLKEDAATRQQFDQAKTEYYAMLAQYNALEQQRRTTNLSTREASKKIHVNEAEIKRAHAILEMAGLNLSYTIITAPYDGVAGRRNIQEGQLVQAGQTLLSFVRNDSKWVVANYKETQVTQLHIGQKMVLQFDGLDKKVFAGSISAISGATGTKYSSVPVDNSTGNFIKVQQRIPVRIEFSAADNDKRDLDLLIAGMNAEVRVSDHN
jgi:membrane fusion protein (multidrug efflux system)